jgi:hypothetical protein
VGEFEVDFDHLSFTKSHFGRRRAHRPQRPVPKYRVEFRTFHKSDNQSRKRLRPTWLSSAVLPVLTSAYLQVHGLGLAGT